MQEIMLQAIFWLIRVYFLVETWGIINIFIIKKLELKQVVPIIKFPVFIIGIILYLTSFVFWFIWL